MPSAWTPSCRPSRGSLPRNSESVLGVWNVQFLNPMNNLRLAFLFLAWALAAAPGLVFAAAPSVHGEPALAPKAAPVAQVRLPGIAPTVALSPVHDNELFRVRQADCS